MIRWAVAGDPAGGRARLTAAPGEEEGTGGGHGQVRVERDRHTASEPASRAAPSSSARSGPKPSLPYRSASADDVIRGSRSTTAPSRAILAACSSVELARWTSTVRWSYRGLSRMQRLQGVEHDVEAEVAVDVDVELVAGVPVEFGRALGSPAGWRSIRPCGRRCIHSFICMSCEKIGPVGEELDLVGQERRPCRRAPRRGPSRWRPAASSSPYRSKSERPSGMKSEENGVICAAGSNDTGASSSGVIDGPGSLRAVTPPGAGTSPASPGPRAGAPAWPSWGAGAGDELEPLLVEMALLPGRTGGSPGPGRRSKPS